MINCNINKKEIINLVYKQLNNFFDNNNDLIEEVMDETLSRTIVCLSAYNNKYYYDKDNIFTFNPYHTGQYTIFLYYLANTIYRIHSRNLVSDKLYYLNKIMNSVDWYYEIKLPDIFNIEHPMSSVLGKANYSNKLFIYQGVTIGGGGVNHIVYPNIGENVLIYSNATILGNTSIGNNVIVSSGCFIKDEIIPDSSIVFGRSPHIVIKQKDYSELKGMLPKWL